jgi:hydrogenase/urease accessory protein HupE
MTSWWCRVRWVGACVLLWCGAAPIWAHDPGLSTAQGDLRDGGLVLTTGFAPADAQEFLPVTALREGSWTQEDFEQVHERLLAVAPQLWEVRADGRAIKPADARVELLPEDNVSFTLVFPEAAKAERLVLRALRIPELPGGHRQFVIVADASGSVITKKLLSAGDATLEVSLAAEGAGPPAAGASTGTAPTFWGFVVLGVEHIWLGYDHLLFLFALLLVCRSFRSIVAIVSCFTLAHSLTLALATFEIVRMPSRLVEAAIAASIVFVGVENLVRRGAEPRGRWALTFAFGLVHGFGFASVLGDLGVGRGGQGIAMPLFSFNLGVEVGQVAIAAVVLPVLWKLRQQQAFVRRGVPALSAVIALAGAYWLLQRTVLG